MAGHPGCHSPHANYHRQTLHGARQTLASNTWIASEVKESDRPGLNLEDCTSLFLLGLTTVEATHPQNLHFKSFTLSKRRE